MKRNKPALESLLKSAFAPLLVEISYLDGYVGYGDRVAFSLFSDDGQHLYDAPQFSLGWDAVIDWVAAQRAQVASLGHQLGPWEPLRR